MFCYLNNIPQHVFQEQVSHKFNKELSSTTGIWTHCILQVWVECSTPVLVPIPGTGISIAASQLRNAVHADSIWLLFLSTNTWNTIAAKKDIPAKERHPCFCVPRCFVVKWQSRGGATQQKTQQKKQKQKVIIFPPDNTENSRFILLAWCCCLLSVWSEVSPCEKIAKNLEGKKNDSLFFFPVSVRCFA